MSTLYRGSGGSLLLRIVEPIATVLPVNGEFPDSWKQGVTYVCKIRIFKWIPIGKRQITIETIDDNNLEIQSREFDSLVRKWDHLIRVEASGNETLYSDELDIEAGFLTPLFLDTSFDPPVSISGDMVCVFIHMRVNNQLFNNSSIYCYWGYLYSRLIEI